jgi:hypothetical protein
MLSYNRIKAILTFSLGDIHKSVKEEIVNDYDLYM